MTRIRGTVVGEASVGRTSPFCGENQTTCSVPWTRRQITTYLPWTSTTAVHRLTTASRATPAPYDPLEIRFRAQCKKGTLVCPSCKEPLRFRRGRLVAAHFAHRATSACRHAKNDKPQHLAARAALYRLLRRKLEADNSPLAAGQLVIEQPSDRPEQTRQIDVRLIPSGGRHSFDYLLFDRLFTYNERDAWDAHGEGSRNLHRLGIGRRFTLNHHGPVAPDDPLPESGTPLEARLAPQETEFAHSSPYAAAWATAPTPKR